MKSQLNQIVVEVTPAQEELINAISKELGGVRPGDLLLSEAFISLAMNYSVLGGGHDGVGGSVAGLSKFIAHRHLPEMVKVSDMNHFVVGSRPSTGRK